MKRLAIVVALFVVALSANAMTLTDYIGALERIESLVRSGQYGSASTESRALIGQRIDSPTGAFYADDALLGAFADPKRIDVRVAPRLAATIAELRRVNGTTANAIHSDPKVLDAVEKEQRVTKPVAGGDLPTDEITSDWTQRMVKAMTDVFDWIGEKLQKFLDWLRELWPKSKHPKPETGGDIRGFVIGIAVAIAIVVVSLAWIAIRRGRRAAPALVESSAPIASKADEDPLSRASNEWERYAAQLANAGRFREAIRAWYHAALVALYSAAILHHRKGRTNWEYVATLSPALPWRREFIELTRRFEHEWYGADESSNDALDEGRRLAKTILTSIARVSRGAA